MNQHERRSRAIAYLAEVAHALSLTEAIEIVLPLILDRIGILFACEAAAFVGVVPARQEFVLLAGSRPGLGSSSGSNTLERALIFPRAGTMLDRALSERTTLALTPTGPGSLDPIMRALLGDYPLESGYVVPLRVAGAERGGLIVINPHRDGDAAEALRDLISFADLAAVAIDRMRLLQTRSDDATRLHVLNAVLQVTSTGLSEETLIRRAMEALLGGLPADRVELMVIEREELQPRYQHGLPYDEAFPERREERLKAHRRALAEGKGFVVAHGQQRTPPIEPHLVCVPLRPDEQKSIGTLLLGRYAAPYEQKELELLTTVGDNIGAAIALSRLLRRQGTDVDSLERALAESASALAASRERLAGLEEERASLQSLASLGELAAGVAHDLNNALNPVVAFAELILEHSDQPERVQMYADRILLAARGGAETVRRIQRFTRRRLGALPFEPVSVSAMVGEVIDLTQPSIGKRPQGAAVTVEESVEPNLIIQGNPGELRQALLNLVANALDAIPGVGTLRFVARGEANEVVLAVQDTGTGMPKAVFDRALEPFFTTKGAHGTGLGLAEVFGIARRHGGNLELESHEGVGTSVMLRLPRTRLKPAPAKARRKLTGAATRVHHILLVDDNLLSLEATAASLRAAGHNVATATNAQIALHIFNAGDYDLVLIDLGLPDMHGLELIDRLRQLNPEIQVGVITGWSSPDAETTLR
jgi:signal transduction histidine kinase